MMNKNKKENILRHNKNNSMSNYMNYSYNYNLRLIPKNKPVNNFDPNALKKTKKNVLNVPMNNGGPIKLKNKDLNSNNINRILNKPKTPDLDKNMAHHQYQQFIFNSNHPRQSHNNFDNQINNKNRINDKNNVKYNRPSTAPQKNKNMKRNQNDSFDNRKKNNILNNNIGTNYPLYNLYNSKRLPSPMLKTKKNINKNKQMKQIKYRAPSPMISPNIGLSNLKRKKILNNRIYDYSQNHYKQMN